MPWRVLEQQRRSIDEPDRGDQVMLRWDADARPSPRDCVRMWSALGPLAGGRLALSPLASPRPGG